MARKAKIEEIDGRRYERRPFNRKVGTKDTRTYFLIVCGGEKTEKLYFDALKRELPPNSVTVETKGERQSPWHVVKSAIRMKNSSTPITYDEVWVVFDKDQFDNFDEAIQEAKRNDIYCGWSNIAFELWYVLHFRTVGPLSQKECEKCIEKEMSSGLKKEYHYDKADKKLYDLLCKYGDQKEAIKRATALAGRYEGQNYSSHNPCTRVHELVEKLLKYKI